MAALVAMVLACHRSGALPRVVLYDVEEDAHGEKNLMDCVAAADGKVRLHARGGRDTASERGGTRQ